MPLSESYSSEDENLYFDYPEDWVVDRISEFTTFLTPSVDPDVTGFARFDFNILSEETFVNWELSPDISPEELLEFTVESTWGSEQTYIETERDILLVEGGENTIALVKIEYGGSFLYRTIVETPDGFVIVQLQGIKEEWIKATRDLFLEILGTISLD